MPIFFTRMRMSPRRHVRLRPCALPAVMMRSRHATLRHRSTYSSHEFSIRSARVARHACRHRRQCLSRQTAIGMDGYFAACHAWSERLDRFARHTRLRREEFSPFV